MAKFRKKSVEIEAFQLFKQNAPVWFMKEVEAGNIRIGKEGRESTVVCRIKTLEGTMTAQSGDYIIKDMEGEIYPCDPNIFIRTYEGLEKEE